MVRIEFVLFEYQLIIYILYIRQVEVWLRDQQRGLSGVNLCFRSSKLNEW